MSLSDKFLTVNDIQASRQMAYGDLAVGCLSPANHHSAYGVDRGNAAAPRRWHDDGRGSIGFVVDELPFAVQVVGFVGVVVVSGAA